MMAVRTGRLQSGLQSQGVLMTQEWLRIKLQPCRTRSNYPEEALAAVSLSYHTLCPIIKNKTAATTTACQHADRVRGWSQASLNEDADEAL